MSGIRETLYTGIGQGSEAMRTTMSRNGRTRVGFGGNIDMITGRQFIHIDHPSELQPRPGIPEQPLSDAVLKKLGIMPEGYTPRQHPKLDIMQHAGLWDKEDAVFAPEDTCGADEKLGQGEGDSGNIASSEFRITGHDVFPGNSDISSTPAVYRRSEEQDNWNLRTPEEGK